MVSPGHTSARKHIVVGVIADTHDVLRRDAVAALENADLIIHAGDIASAKLLESLQALCSTVAVRGNADKGRWAEQLPVTEVVEIGGLYLYVLHDLKTIDLDPAAAGFRAVISGHTHTPEIRSNQGVLFFNPGSAGAQRPGLPPPSVGRLFIEAGDVVPEIIELAVEEEP